MTATEIAAKLGIAERAAQDVMDELARTRPSKIWKDDAEYMSAIMQLYGWMSNTRGT